MENGEPNYLAMARRLAVKAALRKSDRCVSADDVAASFESLQLDWDLLGKSSGGSGYDAKRIR